MQPARLEEYSPAWAEAFADACKPLNPGEPSASIGEGKAAFRSLSAGDTVQVEAGPQGGFHLWVGVRMKNLHQAGSRTSVKVHRTDTDTSLGEFAFGQSYVAVEGGACELVGMRCQLTFQTAFDTEKILGKQLRVTATIADVTGDVGAAEQLITLSETIAKE